MEKRKSRGVVYVIWNGRGGGAGMEKSIQMVSRSVASVRRWTGLPTHLITDKDCPQECESLFDSVARVSWGNCMVGCIPKVWMVESPFDQTLYLDSDTLVMDNLDAGFDKLDQHGMCLSFAPIYNTNRYNAGVMWFDKTVPHVSAFLTAWAETTKSRRYGQCDQGVLHIMSEKMNLCPFVLPHTYNLRAQFGNLQWIHGPLKILHWSGPEPFGHAHWKHACKKAVFSTLEAIGGPKAQPGDKHFVYLNRWVCTQCGHMQKADNRTRRACVRCRETTRKIVHCHLVYPEYWREFDAISTPEEALKWITTHPNRITPDHVIWERETEVPCS